jgi:hypothetical protein
VALIPSNNKSEEEKRAERDARQQEALLREVDDALREDQFSEVVERYGKPGGVVLVLGLAAFAGYLWWSGQQDAKLETGSETIVKAVDQINLGNYDTAAKAYAPLAKDGTSGAKLVAKLSQAAIAAQQGKDADAVKLFTEIAADKDAPQAYRDLATLRRVALDYDKMKPDEVVALLKPLATKGKPYFGSAGELLGAAYLDQGRKDLSGPLFAEISKDKDVPQSLRARTRQLAGMLGVDAIEDVDKTLAEITQPNDPAQGAAQ